MSIFIIGINKNNIRQVTSLKQSVEKLIPVTGKCKSILLTLKPKFQDSWFAQLYEKFRNERKSITDDPEVILHKRRKTKGSEVQPVALKLRRGGINWEPPFPEGEDELSMKRHKEWLQNEYMRREPDLKKVEDRMALTFPDRRKLMNKKVPLTEVRAEYPALFNFKQVLHACNM